LRIQRKKWRVLKTLSIAESISLSVSFVYGVPTKALNQAIKRNADRFPDDFMFQLSREEADSIRSQTVTLKTVRGKHWKYLPYVFTEHGAIMAASVLNSPRAIEASVYVVRAFVKMREVLATHKELVQRLDEMEGKYDRQFKVVFDAIRALMKPPKIPRRRIGY